MVITETGAANAVAKVLPELAGKLTANAIRVPTPNVSLAILNLTLGQESTAEEVNNYLREISLDSSLQGQIDYTSLKVYSFPSEVVSSDFIGSTKTGIVDSLATIAQGKNARCVLYVWYDNDRLYPNGPVKKMPYSQVQLIICWASLQILSVICRKGKAHDFRILKESRLLQHIDIGAVLSLYLP